MISAAYGCTGTYKGPVTAHHYESQKYSEIMLGCLMKRSQKHFDPKCGFGGGVSDRNSVRLTDIQSANTNKTKIALFTTFLTKVKFISV